MRRTRFHQSWYRANVLRLPRYGRTPGPLGQPLGSILHPDDAAAGLNFVTDTAASLYRLRRQEGWGVDPTRCTQYMTSSQALTLNLFGPLVVSEESFVTVLNRVLDRNDITGVGATAVEFAPRRRSEHLNDQSRVDALVRVTTTTGPLNVVFEVKYADRFNSRQVRLDTEPYRALAARSDLWADATVFAERRFNQLARCHALAASAGLVDGLRALPVLVVIHHDLDEPSARLVQDYASTLQFPRAAVAVPLSRFVAAMGASGAGLAHRYCDMSASEPDWLVALEDRANRSA